MLGGFENDRATFYTEQTVEQWDPIKEEYVQDGTEYVAEYKDVPVRSQQADSEHVTEVYGEWPMEVYRLWVDPGDVGLIGPYAFGDGVFGDGIFGGDFEYCLGISANDRVELSGVTGRFSIQPPNLQRLDSQIPEVVEVEITKTS